MLLKQEVLAGDDAEADDEPAEYHDGDHVHSSLANDTAIKSNQGQNAKFIFLIWSREKLST